MKKLKPHLDQFNTFDVDDYVFLKRSNSEATESSFLKNYCGPSLGHATFSHPEDKMNRLKDWDAFDQWTPAPQPVTGAPIEYECGFKDCELYEDAYEDYY